VQAVTGSLIVSSSLQITGSFSISGSNDFVLANLAYKNYTDDAAAAA
jgi:hypothetical protein